MSAPLLAACLCAAWCGTCRDYRVVFEAETAKAGARAAWVDIEDDEALVDGIDVDDFPTGLIARDGVVVFFGPLTPQPATLARLLEAARDGALAPQAVPPPVSRLLGRLQEGRDAG